MPLPPLLGCQVDRFLNAPAERKLTTHLWPHSRTELYEWRSRSSVAGVCQFNNFFSMYLPVAQFYSWTFHSPFPGLVPLTVSSNILNQAAGIWFAPALFTNISACRAIHVLKQTRVTEMPLRCFGRLSHGHTSSDT